MYCTGFCFGALCFFPQREEKSEKEIILEPIFEFRNEFFRILDMILNLLRERIKVFPRFNEIKESD